MKGSIKKYTTKKGNKYRLVVDIGKDPKTSKRRQKKVGGFLRKKDAEAALRKILIEIGDGYVIEPTKETFAEFIENWFTSHYKKRIKETTYANRKYTVEKHLIKENNFATKRLSDITTEDIDAFYNDKVDEGNSSSYIRKMHQVLNQAFTQALKWKKISMNPVLDANPPSVKKEEMRIWSFQEIQSFLQQCKDERLYILFLLAVYTGMRRGELLALKWSDIDFAKKCISVRHSLSYIKEKGYILTRPKTNRSIRKIPVSEFVLTELRKHQNQQEIWMNRLGEAYQQNNLVICTEFGTAQDPRNVLRAMKRIINKAKVSPIRFHDLRHTHASILISEGVDMVKVAARLGHTSPKTTLNIYAHLVPNNDNEVADIFEQALQRW